MNIVVDNLMTNYELTGSGKLVVLLHGWGDRARGLAALQRRLSARYQVVALDLPGFGGSQPPEESWDLDDYAAFTAAFLEKLGLPKPFAILGHSNGGSLAIRGLSVGQLQADKLVLLASAGIREGNSLRRLGLKIVARTGNLVTLWMPDRYRRGLRKSLYGVAGSDILVAPQLEETFKRTVRQDVQADAAKLELPTLLVYGDQDRATPVAMGQRYHQLIKGSRLETIPGAGHFLHVDAAEQVENLVEDFLA